MSIPIAVDGSTLVNAALLNAYKSGIDDLVSGASPAGSLAIAALTAESTVDQSADYVPMYDASGAVVRKVLVRHLCPITTKGDLVAGGASGALTRLPVGTDGQVLTVDSAEAVGVKWAPGGMVKLGEQSGAAASYSFTDISGSYRHLLVQGAIRSDGAFGVSYCRIAINNDSGANYDQLRLQTDHTTVAGSQSTAGSYVEIGLVTGASADAGRSASLVIHIPDYAGSLQKTMQAKSGAYPGGGANFYGTEVWGNWRNTAAVTRVDISPGAGSFVSGSVVSLYGIV